MIVKDENYTEPTAVKIEGGDSYNTLSEAVSEAKDGDLIIINESHALSEKLTIDKKLTIKGNGNNITITNPTEVGAYLIQNEVVFDNISLNGSSSEGDTYITVDSDAGKLILKDVTISNYTCIQDVDLIKTANGGKVRIENLNTSGVNLSEGAASVTIDDAGSTINGNNSISLKLNNGSFIEVANAIDDDNSTVKLTNTDPIKLYFNGFATGSAIIKSCREEDLNRFSINSDEYTLAFNNGNIVLEEIVPEPTKIIINGKGYDSLEAALEAAKDGDEIQISEDIEISNPIKFDSNITIVGIKQEDALKTPVLTLAKGCEILVNSQISISNLDIDANGKTGSGLIKVVGADSELSLDNVNISGYTPLGENASVIKAYDGGKVILRDMSVNPTDVISIGLYNDGSQIKGSNDISIFLSGKTSIEKSVNLTNSEKIKIITDAHDDGDIVIKGCNPEDAQKFELSSNDLELAFKDGNLILVKKNIDIPDDPEPEPSKIIIEGKDKGYDSLSEAISDAEDGDKIILNSEVEITAPLNINKNISIEVNRVEGSDDNPVLKMRQGASLMIDSKVDFSGLEIDGGGETGGDLIKVSGNNAVLTLNEVSISNYSPVEDAYIISVINNGKLHLSNVELNSGNNPENALVRISVTGSSISGNNKLSIYLSGKSSIAVRNELTNDQLITIFTDEHEIGDVLVTDCVESDFSKFKFILEDYIAEYKDGDIVLMKEVTETPIEPETYKILNSTKDKGYDNLVEAINEASSNDVLVINENVEISSSLIIYKPLAIVGKEITETQNKAVVRFIDGVRLSVTTKFEVKSLIFEGDGKAGNRFIEVMGENASLSLENIEITGFNSTGEDGALVSVKDGGIITLNNVNIKESGSSFPPYSLYLTGNGSTIQGNNSMSIYLDNDSYITVSGKLENENPISLSVGSPEDNRVLVANCSEYDLEKFTLNSEDFHLELKDNKLVIEKNSVEAPEEPDLPELFGVTIKGRENGFATLQDAVINAENGDQIEIRTLIDINTELVINKRLTITSVSDKNFENSPELRFEKKGVIKVTSGCKMENLKLNGGGISGSGLVKVIGENSSLSLDNIEFSNYTAVGTPATVINVTSGGKVDLRDVTMGDKISLPTGAASVWISGNGSTISGYNSLSIFLIGKTSISSGGKLSNTNPVKIYTDAHEDGDVIVSGAGMADLNRFILISEEYKLNMDEYDRNIIMSKIVQDPSEEPEQGCVAISGKDKVYSSLQDALVEAEPGDIIEILDNIILSSTLLVDKDVKIVGASGRTRAGDKTTIINGGGSPAFCIKGNVSLENLIIDGDNKQGGCIIDFTGNNVELRMKDMEIHNYTYGASGDSKKLIHVSEGNKIHINNLITENVAGTGDTGMIAINEGGCTLDGNNKVSVHLNRSHTISVARNGNLTHKEPIEIFVSSHEHGSPVVMNCEDPSLFKVKGWNLVSENGNLVLRDMKSGIDGLYDESQLPEEYFNLNGLRVDKDKLLPGIYVRKKGKKSVKIIIR